MTLMAQQLLAHNSAQSLLNQRIVFADSLSVSLTRFIQSGSYAHVFEALNEATGDVLAVKCIVKQGLSPSSIEKQRFEAHVLTSLAASNTPHVISVLAHSETRDYIFLLMTRYQDDLLDLINDGSICASTSGGFYDYDDALDMGLIVQDVFVQICLAIEACHALGVFHQDIKPENILINTHRGRIQACLSDFGLATTTAHPDTFGCGSISYTSPESLAGQDSGSTAESYSARAQDAWSLAVLLFILITGYTPWHCANVESDPSFAAYQAWLHDGCIGVSNLRRRFGFTGEVEFLFARCFAEDPRKRMGVKEMREWILQTDVVFVPFGPPAVSPVSTAAPQLMDVGTPGDLEDGDVTGSSLDDLRNRMHGNTVSRQKSWSSDMSEMDYSHIPVFDEGIMASLLLDEEAEDSPSPVAAKAPVVPSVFASAPSVMVTAGSPIKQQQPLFSKSPAPHSHWNHSSHNKHNHNLNLKSKSPAKNSYFQYAAPPSHSFGTPIKSNTSLLGPHVDNWREHRQLQKEQHPQAQQEMPSSPPTPGKWKSRRVEALRVQQAQRQHEPRKMPDSPSGWFNKRPSVPHHAQSPPKHAVGAHMTSRQRQKSNFWKSSLVREEEWVWRRDAVLAGH